LTKEKELEKWEEYAKDGLSTIQRNKEKVTLEPQGCTPTREIVALTTSLGSTRLSVTTRRMKEEDSRLIDLYGLSKYSLRPEGYTFPKSIQPFIPSKVSNYVDRGEGYLEKLARALHLFKQAALIGPSGTGKTHIVYALGEAMSLPIWEVNCGVQTSAGDLFGKFIGLGKENWVDGPILSWAKNGGILYLDEANMMKQDVAARLNPILDDREHFVLTEKDGEVIRRHPLGYVVLSMNPSTQEFVGTKKLNAALRRRMGAWLHFDYLSVSPNISEEEVHLIMEKGDVDEATAKKIVQVAAELRRKYKNGDLPYGPSVSDLSHWAQLIAEGICPQEAAQQTIVALTSDETEVQEEVMKIIQMVFEESPNILMKSRFGR